MNNNKENIIDEQDLFNYIFFPVHIPEEKKTIIESDELFKEILDFYRNMKADILQTQDDTFKKKIAEKIPAYSLVKNVQLYELKNPVVPVRVINHLAADSKEFTAKLTTKTFVDNDKDYLIKVLNYGSMTKIFVFSANKETVENFDIIIEPHNLRYHFENNTTPLKIEQSIEAESIRLEFV